MASESVPRSLVQKPVLGDQVLQKKEEVLREPGIGVSVSWGGEAASHTSVPWGSQTLRNVHALSQARGQERAIMFHSPVSAVCPARC